MTEFPFIRWVGMAHLQGTLNVDHCFTRILPAIAQIEHPQSSWSAAKCWRNLSVILTAEKAADVPP
jgi:hypothetical protein